MCVLLHGSKVVHVFFIFIFLFFVFSFPQCLCLVATVSILFKIFIEIVDHFLFRLHFQQNKIMPLKSTVPQMVIMELVISIISIIL